MPPSNSPFAYEDIREALQRALDSKKGIRIKAATHGAAVGLQCEHETAADRLAVE